MAEKKLIILELKYLINFQGSEIRQDFNMDLSECSRRELPTVMRIHEYIPICHKPRVRLPALPVLIVFANKLARCLKFICLLIFPAFEDSPCMQLQN
jgi:hypothetical protein